MATGAIDANGVYRYGEDDEIPTLSSFLDLGQAAQSANFSGVKARLSAVEALTQVPVMNGRFSASGTIVNGSVIGVPTWTAVAGFSSTGSSTLYTPVTNGIRLNKRGIYKVQMMVGCTAKFEQRNFMDFNLAGYGSKRAPWYLSGEDNVALEATVICPADNVALTFGTYQASGVSKAFTYLLDITRLGNFS